MSDSTNPPQALEPHDVEKKLSEIPEWGSDSDVNSISRTWQFRDFPQSMNFANAVAALAEEYNHHPEILISYDTVTLVLSTHSAGGLTDKDFLLAHKIDELPEAAGEVQKDEPFLAG